MPNLATPFQEASDAIASKPAVSKAIFRQLLPELKARAFTITGIEDFDVLQAARDEIARLPLGGDWNEIKASLEEKLSPWLNPIAAEKRAELLLRTHGFQAYGAANYQNLEAMKDVFPFRQYQSSEDSRVRASHAALDKIVLPADSPFWLKHTPPWEYNCRCDVVGLTKEDVDELRADDAALPPEKRLVLEGPAKQQVEVENKLTRGMNEVHDLRTPLERNDGQYGYEWEPGTLTMPLDTIRRRYDPDIWTQFQGWARQTLVTGETFSVWEWLMSAEDPAMRAKIAAAPKPAPYGAPAAPPVTAPAAPPPAPGQPAAAAPPGAPVADSLDVSSLSAAELAAAAAVTQAIGRTHGDGALKLAALKAVPGTTGCYCPSRYYIEFGRGSHTPHVQIAHEIGHKLDFEALQAARRADANLEKAWKAVIREIKATPEVKQIAKWAKTGPHKGHCKYLMHEWELWARAYSQFLAGAGGEPKLAAEIDLRRSGNEPGRLKESQWTDAAFAPIRQKIETLLRAAGWMA